MLVRRPSDKTSLVECPVCTTDLRGRESAGHLFYEHGPEDFGLSPMWRDFAPSHLNGPLFVNPKPGNRANVVHLFGDCRALSLAETVVPADAASLTGHEDHCALCKDREVDA